MWAIRTPDIEDWEAVKALWEELQASPQAKHVDGDLFVLKEFLKASWTSPMLNVWGAFADGVCLALVITQIISAPEVRNSQVVNVPSLFIRAVYTKKGAPPKVTRDLDETITVFAKQVGCANITGACRMDFPVAAAQRRHGYTSSHIIMSKKVT